MLNAPPLLFFDRIGPRQGAIGTIALIVAIALADYATGYEVRLSILYLVPIALATWAISPLAGIAAALTASLFWLASFDTAHFYSHRGYFLWEGMVMLTGFLAFALLLIRLRQALSQADERFIRVLEEMHAGVYVVDEQLDELLYANPEILRLTGGDITHGFEGELRREPTAADYPAPMGGGGFQAETVHNQRTGCWYLMQSGGIPWGARPGVVLKVLTDISAQMTADALRQKHLDTLHQTARLSTMAEIASTLAHEINQPLMVIATYTDACQRMLEMPDHDRAEVVAALGKCRAQAVRAATIIERLRDFIRQRQHRPEPCDANAIATEAIDMMRIPLAESMTRIDMELPASAPMLIADRTLLIQVLVNLLRNAIDAMRENVADSRLVSVSISVDDAEEVVFSVGDHGPGLTQSQAESLFIPFYTTKPDGLGLGLAICRSVAEVHGGRLWADPNPAGGTVFRLSVPSREKR